MFYQRTEIKSKYTWNKCLGNVVVMLHVVNPPWQHLRNHEARVSDSTTTPPGLLVSKAISIGLVPLRNSLEAQRSARGKQKTLILDAVFFLMVFVWALQEGASPSWPSLCPGQLCTCSPRTMSAEDYMYGALPQHDPRNPWPASGKICTWGMCVCGCYDDFLFVILASSLKKSWSLASRNLQAHRARTRKLKAIGWHSSE
jgi:hypothetical protein